MQRSLRKFIEFCGFNKLFQIYFFQINKLDSYLNFITKKMATNFQNFFLGHHNHLKQSDASSSFLTEWV
jgi:hypothetical protein